MAIPTEELAQHLAGVVSDQWSVIRSTSSVEALAVVIRSDEPWIVPSAFCHDEQMYAAVAAVPVASPEDGEANLYEVIHSIMDNLPEGWQFVSASRMGVDRSTGTDLLTARIRLRYLNNPPEAS